MERKVIFFEKPGPQNTEETIRAAKRRAEELGIAYVVVASASGDTALKVAEAFKNSPARVVAVTYHAGFAEMSLDRAKELGIDPNELTTRMKPENMKALEERGVRTVQGSHALSGVSRSISKRFGGITPVEVIAATLRLISQGVKVAVEVSVMAADADAIPTDREVLVITGNIKGAD
ncbi:MAG: pyruvate kinase alpha/beta domain-containing protein, partial [Candidatus Bathyarchaeia archaeon]